MIRADRIQGAWIAWRALTRSQLREHPLQLLATIAAIALGVALGSAVYLVNGAALEEFDQATRRLVGAADIVIRGPPEGFDEALFVSLARQPAVSAASPLLELELTLPGAHPPLKLLALDPFRAAALQPVLMGEIGPDITRLFARDAIVLSRAAAQELGLRRGDALPIIVGAGPKSLQVIDVLSDSVYPEPLGIMDIASAQWSLERIGRLNRIDLRARPGTSVPALRSQIAAALPAGVVAVTPAIERGRALTATRAYRVNLNMLALVTLLTGAFLVFSTQSLAVLRRREALGLLRALGVTRSQLQCALLGEGAAIGAAGSVLGALLGAVVAALVLRYLGSDLGNRALAAMSAVLVVRPWPMAVFVLVGTGVACLGAWIPASEAARRAPALAMKAGDAEPALTRLPTASPGLALIAAGAVLAWLPPLGGLPVAGYLAIAALLAGAVLLIPTLMQWATGAARRSGRATLDTAVAQLLDDLRFVAVAPEAVRPHVFGNLSKQVGRCGRAAGARDAAFCIDDELHDVVRERRERQERKQRCRGIAAGIRDEACIAQCVAIALGESVHGAVCVGRQPKRVGEIDHASAAFEQRRDVRAREFRTACEHDDIARGERRFERTGRIEGALETAQRRNVIGDRRARVRRAFEGTEFERGMPGDQPDQFTCSIARSSDNVDPL